MSTEVKAQNTISMTSVKAIADATEQSKQLLATMEQYAEDAGTTLTGIYQDAMDAQTSADNASEYATRAYANLSTVQNITETLNWITAHGTMALTSDVALDPSHIYFVVNPQGDYVVGGTHYSVVSEPNVADISTYYELTIDESLNNYVATHLAVDSEGLWIIPDAGGNKVLIATGNGSTYTTAGTYIVGTGNVILARFSSSILLGYLIDGSTQPYVEIDNSGFRVSDRDIQDVFWAGIREGTDEYGQQSIVPCVDIGTRRFLNYTDVGAFSVAEGYDAKASGYASHAEGYNTTASGFSAHAEGHSTTATSGAHAEGYQTTGNYMSHAEGYYSQATGNYSHAQNNHTIAQRKSQTAIGEYNIADTTGADGTAKGDYILIVGNGTADNARANALTVDWGGNVDATGDVNVGGNVDATGTIISDTNYEDAWQGTGQGYEVTGLSLAGSTYVKVDIDIGVIGVKKPIFNGFDIQGSGTARIHTLGHYVFQDNGHWYASVKMRNDNTSAISSYSVTAYIAWV